MIFVRLKALIKHFKLLVLNKILKFTETFETLEYFL